MKRCENSNNFDIGKTQITDKIRISTAAIFYDEWFGKRWQLETWCFSDDPRQKTFQVIHGDISTCDPCNDEPKGLVLERAEKAHYIISNNLKKIVEGFGEDNDK